MNQTASIDSNAPPFMRSRSVFSSSFLLPILMMRGEKRRAMQTLYRFCHAVDNCADDIANKHDALVALERWQNALENWEQAKVLPKKMQCFFEPFTLYKRIIPHLQNVIRGVRMDVEHTFMWPSLEELLNYNYHVAGCVGLAAIEIFGCTQKQSNEFAITLGHALQLTNIARDVLEDAARGRVYLAKEWSEKEIAPKEVLNDPTTITPALQMLLKQADDYYTQSEALIHAHDRIALRPALLMRAMYRAQLDKMLKHENHLTENVQIRLSLPEKLSIMWKNIS